MYSFCGALENFVVNRLKVKQNKRKVVGVQQGNNKEAIILGFWKARGEQD